MSNSHNEVFQALNMDASLCTCKAIPRTCNTKITVPVLAYKRPNLYNAHTDVMEPTNLVLIQV